MEESWTKRLQELLKRLGQAVHGSVVQSQEVRDCLEELHEDGWRAVMLLSFLSRLPLPMLYALDQKIPVDVFSVWTDSETWAGSIHPAQALRLYRDEFVSDAKAVVVGMTSNGFSLADPNDRGMLDVAGFDTTVPAVIADFVRS